MKKRKTKKLVARRPRFKPMEVIIFQPKWSVPDWDKVGVLPGEAVLFMGTIPNVPDHCAIAKNNGEVRWLMHPEDFRKATEDEL